MSADKFAGRARRLAVTAIAAGRGLSTGIKHMPPSDDPDIKAAERAGWIARTSERFGCWGSGRGRVTIFRATPAGRAALAKYGASD